MQSHERDAIS